MDNTQQTFSLFVLLFFFSFVTNTCIGKTGNELHDFMNDNVGMIAKSRANKSLCAKLDRSLSEYANFQLCIIFLLLTTTQTTHLPPTTAISTLELEEIA